jgi:hypothetical protein
MAVSFKMAVFCVVALCSLIEVNQHFRDPFCQHLHCSDVRGSKNLFVNFYQTMSCYNPEDRHIHVY